MTTTPIQDHHWADHAAMELIEAHPQAEIFVCASGISPSGFVHIGNFREVITTDFVVRALRNRGKKIRFIYSWDDYDAFRKVPANLPNPEGLNEDLRVPLSKVRDPFGKASSYADFFEKIFERELDQLGIHPEFIYQSKAYESGKYQKGIQTALEHNEEIRAILDEGRTEPLPKDWICATVYCKKCKKDATKKLQFRPPSSISYHCSICKEEGVTDFTKEPGVKLLWRVDWPMRWNEEGVLFEPGGKDHSSTGGSYETGTKIVRKIWKREPPKYLQYDFVLAKGAGSKFSSSSGNLLTLSDALSVYEPSIIRYLFASRRSNMDFSIAFDLDVLKTYDEFDRAERLAYGLEQDEPIKVNYEKRIYLLSLVDPSSFDPAKPPVQFPLRHLCNLLQIMEGDLIRIAKHYFPDLKGEDLQRLQSRGTRAWNWIQNYAPPEFRFKLRDENDPPYASKMPMVLKKMVEILSNPDFDKLTETAAHEAVYAGMKDLGMTPREFFPEIYQALISKPNGPKLAAFLQTIGAKRAIEILEKNLK